MALGDVLHVGTFNFDGSGNGTLPFTPVAGNTVYLDIAHRDDTNTITPSGFTPAYDYITAPADGFQQFGLVGFYRHVQPGDTSAVTASSIFGVLERLTVAYHIEGTVSPTDHDPHVDADKGCVSPVAFSLGTVIATTDDVIVISTIIPRNNTGVSNTSAWDSPWTEQAEVNGLSTGGLSVSSAYRRISGASGGYTPTGTETFAGCLRGWISSTMLFDVSVIPPPPGPGDQNDIHDDDDVFLDTIVNVSDKVIRIERQGWGSGTFKIRRDADDADLVGTGRDGRMVVVTIPRISPDPIFRWMIENVKTVVAHEDEDGEELITVAGRGALAYLERAVWSPYSYVNPGDPPADGVIHGPAGTGNKAGQILWRMMQEAQHIDRPQQPIPLVTYDFTQTVDSEGNTWTLTAMTEELSSGRIGEPYTKGIEELWGTGGIEILMLPDMELYAVNSYGRDLTGLAFGAGVVRFVKGVNIADRLSRTRGTDLPKTHMWVKGTGAVYVNPPVDLPDAGSRPVVEGFLETEGTDTDALAEIGLQALIDGLRRGESVALNILVPMPGEEDEDAGLYLPGPEGTNGHYWIGDTITVSTGEGVDDFDDEDARIEAITIHHEDANNMRVKVELVATTILGRGVRPGTPGSGAGPTNTTGGSTPPPLPTNGQVEAHLVDTIGAHQAQAISIIDGDGHYAANNVEDALDEVYELAAASGPSIPFDHNNMGATETVDLGDGDWHRGTLNANCAITVQGFTVDEGAVLLFEVTQDGTGGWDITWDVDVDFGGADDQPDQTAGSITHYLLWSSEGDSTIYGAKVGAGVSDHGALTGLADDDHTQYVLRSILTTRGDLFRRGATAIERVALGTTGQVLTSDGTDAVWDDAPSGNPADDTQAWMPLSTVDGGEPVLVWDGDDSLIPTLVTL